VQRPSRQKIVGLVTAVLVVVALVAWGLRKEARERELVAEQKARAEEQARLRAEAEQKSREVDRLRREVERLQKLERAARAHEKKGGDAPP